MFPRLTKHNPYPPTVSPPSVLKFLSTSKPWALFLVSLLHVSARIAQSWYWLGHWLDDEEIVRFTAEPQNVLFFRTTRSALRPSQQPIQWVPAVVCLAVQQPERDPDHSFRIIPSKELVYLYIHLFVCLHVLQRDMSCYTPPHVSIYWKIKVTHQHSLIHLTTKRFRHTC